VSGCIVVVPALRKIKVKNEIINALLTKEKKQTRNNKKPNGFLSDNLRLLNKMQGKAQR